MATITTRRGETVDLVALRAFGATKDFTEALFSANPLLRSQPLILPSGLVLMLPDPAKVNTAPPTIALWS